MIAVALKGLAARKVRALLTAFAVVIGVSMVSGTFILTDTMQKTFDGLFAASYEDSDRNLGGRCRREGDVPGVRRGIARISTVLRRAGLRCDLHAGDGSLLLRHLLGGDHQIRKCIRDLLGPRPPLLARSRRADVREVGSLQIIDKVGLHGHPFIRDGRGDLQ